ncbi:MAG: cytochrome c oxidase assembly protein [Pseudomonadota bacterium]
MTRPTPAELRRKAIPLVGVAFGMLGMAYAAVPLYDWFCRVTGFGGTPMESSEVSSEILDRTITVRFDANKERGMPWEFKPAATTAEIRIGETGLAFYEAYNPTDRPVTGSASFNVAPFSMGGYFVKIDCFCFQEQTLQPGERVMMPVTYYVDPEMVEDRETVGLSTVTLSYTFHEIETEDAQRAALDTN